MTNAELSRSRRRLSADEAREQRISERRRKQKGRRLSAQVKSSAKRCHLFDTFLVHVVVSLRVFHFPTRDARRFPRSVRSRHSKVAF